MLNSRSLPFTAIFLVAIIIPFGGSSPTINRILIIGYGQSNMDTFFSACDAPCTPPNPPADIAGTQFYNGPSLVQVPNANGPRVLQNNVTSATGIPTVTFNCAVGGSNIAGFISGTGAFNTCVSEVNALITPRDKVFIIWDQGEGDANTGGTQVPDYYAPTLVQLHKDFVAAIGRTTASAPFLTSQLGSSSGLPGGVSFGTTQQTWQVVKNAQATAPLYEAGGNMIFSHTDMDFLRTDGYHYDGIQGQKFAGQRFAQSINTLMGVASPSGFPNWSISGTSTVDATHTTVAVTQNLGTDFTPTSGITSFEVSGNNGATWISATGSRTDATQISLVHSSLTTTNARLVRYLYGFSPPDVNINCYSALGGGPCSPPSALVLDNSSLSIPLSPTTWNLRPTPTGSTLPMPTWRDTNTSAVSTQVQSVSGLQLGPENVQKFVILSLSNLDLSLSPISSWRITPQDFLGNSVGSTVSPSTTPVIRVGNVALFGITLNANNASASTFKIDITYSTNPFGNSVFQVWTVPVSDLSSTTATASNSATASSAAAVTTTLNTSAGGLVVCTANDSAGAGSGSFSGSISGTLLTAGASSKTFAVGQVISSVAGGGPGNVTPNVTIISQASGTAGGAGTYNLSGPSQTVSPAQSMNNSTGMPVLSSSSGESFGLRWGSNFIGFDSANSVGSTPASATITFNESGATLNQACASWR